MDVLSDAGSIPAGSTKSPKDEHLLFQRRLCRNGVVLRGKQKKGGQILNLTALFAMYWTDLPANFSDIPQVPAFLPRFHKIV